MTDRLVLLGDAAGYIDALTGEGVSLALHSAQALAVREQLRGALTGTNELIQALKAERRSQRSLKLALDSLKQLQAVA